MIERDRTIRAVVLTGAGRAFCAGQDLKERLEPDATPLEVEVRERYNPIIAAMRRLDQPIVGAINGVAAGAGASLAFACDLRIAAEGASFVLAFERIGLVPDSGATWFLPRLVGPAKAAELALLGEPLCGRRRGTVRPGRPGRAGRRAGCRGEVDGSPAGGPGAAGRRADQASARTELVGRPRARSRTRRTGRGSPGPRPTTPRAWQHSWTSGHRGSPGSSRARLDDACHSRIGCPNKR